MRPPTVRETVKQLRFMRALLGRGMVHLNLQLLYQCNFRCRICDFWRPPYTEMPRLSAAQVAVIANKLPAPLIVSIGGGEPLLHPELPEVIAILARRHFPVMITNGWFATPERARAIMAAGLYEVSVSLDYADPQRHDAQRGVPGAFGHAVAALANLHRARVSPHQRVHMISVVMDDNLDEIEPLILLARELGVTYLVTCYSHSRGRKECHTTARDLSARLLALKKRHPNFVAIRGFLGRFTEAVGAPGGVRPCYAGRNLFNIDCQGQVSRCIDRLDQVAGNILDEDYAPIAKRLRAQQRANDCGDCWTSCRGNFETLMYGPGRLRNLMDSWQVTRAIPLGSNSPTG